MSSQTKALSTILKDLVHQSNQQTRRMRVLEEKADAITNRMKAVEDTLLRQKKHWEGEEEGLAGNVHRIETRLDGIEQQIKEIVAEIKKMPTAVQVKELEHLLNIFNPLKSNFITQEEAGQIIEQKLRQRV